MIIPLQLNRKRLKIIVAVLVILLLTGFFLVRGMILRKAIASLNSRISSHHYVAHWDGARFRGLRTVFVKGLYIQSDINNNEANIDSLRIRVRMLPLII